jgi:hypothetical protein
MLKLDVLREARRVIEEAPAEHVFLHFFSCGSNYCALGWMRQDDWFCRHTELPALFTMTPRAGGVDIRCVVPAAHATFDERVAYDDAWRTRLNAVFGMTTEETRAIFFTSVDPGVDHKQLVLERLDVLIDRAESASLDAEFSRELDAVCV